MGGRKEEKQLHRRRGERPHAVPSIKFIGIYEASSVVFFFASPLISAYRESYFSPSNENIKAIKLVLWLIIHLFHSFICRRSSLRKFTVNQVSRWIGY
jgi:hypothetical protein